MHSEAATGNIVVRGRPLPVISKSEATKQSSLSVRAVLDCFAQPVIGPAKPNPLARNDGARFYAAFIR